MLTYINIYMYIYIYIYIFGACLCLLFLQVLPLPVFATPTTSLPSMMTGQVCAWPRHCSIIAQHNVIAEKNKLINEIRIADQFRFCVRYNSDCQNWLNELDSDRFCAPDRNIEKSSSSFLFDLLFRRTRVLNLCVRRRK